MKGNLHALFSEKLCVLAVCPRGGGDQRRELRLDQPEACASLRGDLTVLNTLIIPLPASGHFIPCCSRCYPSGRNLTPPCRRSRRSGPS